MGLPHAIGSALAETARRIDLEYFGIDCAETKDGELLIFEADNVMIVHNMDSLWTSFPTSPRICERSSNSFAAMLYRRARHAGLRRLSMANDLTCASGVTLDPADWESVRAQAHRMLDDMLDYTEHVRSRPVWQPIPDSVRARFRSDMPCAPSELADVYDEFSQFILPYATGNVHPGFMGWVHGGGTVTGMLAEMLAAGLNANLGGRDHMPIEVERQITEWVRQMFGFPAGASGLFVTGTSMANPSRCSSRAPRRWARMCVGRASKTEPSCAPTPRARPMAVSHKPWISSDWGLTPCGLFRSMPCSASMSERFAMLLRQIVPRAWSPSSWSVRPGLSMSEPWMIWRRLARFAGMKIWFHVDGAYGALAVLSPELAPRLAGIQDADSIAFDFHKWGQVPYDAGFILVRDGEQHRETFASPAAYLRRETRGLSAGAHWPCDYGPDLSRGFRALKTWFTLKTYGTDLLGAVMARSCALARYLEERVLADPRLELVAPAQLNIVCFRYRADDSNRINAKIVADLHESGIAAPSTTMINGRLAIRAAFVNHRTQSCDVDALVESVLDFGDANVPARQYETETATARRDGRVKRQERLSAQIIGRDRQALANPIIGRNASGEAGHSDLFSHAQSSLSFRLGVMPGRVVAFVASA